MKAKLKIGVTLIHKFCDQNHFLTQSFYTEKVLDDYEFNLPIDLIYRMPIHVS